MANLTKSEQEINSDIYSNDRISSNFFSFSEAEKQIQKLKNNYNEIKDIKSKKCTIIDIDNIKKYEEILYTIPKSFDDLIKASFLILEDLKIYEQKNSKKIIKDNIRDGTRKLTDIFTNNTALFKSANDTSSFISKNKKIFRLYDNDRKKTDMSVKVKDILTENNEDTNIFKISNKKLTSIKYNNNTPLVDSGRKSSEIKLLTKTNISNGVDNSRYTPKSLKLPKIILNNDKEKRNNNFVNQYSDDIKKAVDFHKSTNLSKPKNK